METKRWFRTFKNSQKIRVVVSGVILITRADWVTDGSVSHAIHEIDRIRDAGNPCVGLCGEWNGKQIQVDLT